MRNSKGQFIKGYKPIWSEVSRKKVSETCKKRGIGKWMTGRKPTEATREKLSQNSARYWLGKKRGKQSKETIEKRMLKIRGKKSPASRKRFLENNPNKGKFGKQHPCWKEDKKATFYLIVRSSYKYIQWRKAVLKRDNWICQECGKRGGDLEAHHKKPFVEIIRKHKIKTIEQAIICKELWDINNGHTVCIPCHKKVDAHRR